MHRNIDDYRRKNRERMARHRASDNAATPEERQARLEKRRFAAAQYREKYVFPPLFHVFWIKLRFQTPMAAQAQGAHASH
jgi:hypothetical protein